MQANINYKWQSGKCFSRLPDVGKVNVSLSQINEKRGVSSFIIPLCIISELARNSIANCYGKMLNQSNVDYIKKRCPRKEKTHQRRLFENEISAIYRSVKCYEANNFYQDPVFLLAFVSELLSFDDAKD